MIAHIVIGITKPQTDLSLEERKIVQRDIDSFGPRKLRRFVVLWWWTQRAREPWASAQLLTKTWHRLEWNWAKFDSPSSFSSLILWEVWGSLDIYIKKLLFCKFLAIVAPYPVCGWDKKPGRAVSSGGANQGSIGRARLDPGNLPSVLTPWYSFRPSLVASIFSCRLHLARLFWNHTWNKGEYQWRAGKAFRFKNYVFWINLRSSQK